jgi:stage II sporulation protein D
MNKIKSIIVLVVFIVVVTLIIPSLLVFPFSGDKASGKLKEKESQIPLDKLIAEASAVEVAVLRSANNQVEKIPLESYVVGVVASEMPADFEKEALKAQALTARTYIVKQLMSGSSIGNGASVTDTVNHQVYKNDKELKEIWGSDYSWKMKKIQEAVYETRGQILTYNKEPITASFFSTSNGYTENSEDYWDQALPYLKSVESPWDKDSPKFYNKKVFTVQEFEQLLGVNLPNNGDVGTILERTKGQRVAKVNINGKIFTGREVREKLGLHSSDFTWERKGDEIIIQTEGYGHGVGMSQYGANGMAKEGKTYKEIVQYYYQGVEISEVDSFLEKYVAKQ